MTYNHRHFTIMIPKIIDKGCRKDRVMSNKKTCIGDGRRDAKMINDHLTKTLNQQGLHKKITHLSGVKKAISFFVDIKAFSMINDYYGYETGNRFLKVFVRDLKRLFNKRCLVSRYSGAQFVVVCYGMIKNKHNLEDVFDRLISLSEKPYDIHGHEVSFKMSVGYAVFPDDTNDLNRLISLSSIATKHASNDKKCAIIRYESQMGEALHERVLVGHRIMSAMEHNEIDVFFQKVIDVETKEVTYVEELVRWTDKEIGYISPDRLFDAAKDFHMTNKLEIYICEKTFAYFSRFREQSQYGEIKLSVNLTPESLTSKTFFNHFDEIVDSYGIDKDDICIEISEKAFVNHTEVLIASIHMINQKGYRIALDDFGKDYSSLSMLEKIPFDIIKIDKLFIDDIQDEKNQEIIKMVRNVSKLSSAEIIAEGVETQSQSDILQFLDCRQQQGYLHHKPEKLL